MQHRSPARFLAPWALIIATIAVYVLAQPPGDSGSPSSTPSVATNTKTATRPAKRPATKKLPKRYTVKSGDTLSGIADKTGVPLGQILELNNVDANSLTIGRKLKLRR